MAKFIEENWSLMLGAGVGYVSPETGLVTALTAAIMVGILLVFKR